MGIGVNDLSAENIAQKAYSKYSNKVIDTNVSKDDSSSYLDFDGYLELLTAQMSNQDFNNAMSDSEFIQQMSSYSMMEAINQLTKQNALSYNAALIGKAVTVTDSSGLTETGVVEAVTVNDGNCMLLVNGSQYSADTISDVIDADTYKLVSGFRGQTVEVKDGDDTVTGKVIAVNIKNGNGFVTLEGGATYSIEAVKNVISDKTEEEGSDNAEGTEGTDKAESTDVTEGTAKVEDNAAAYTARNEKNGVTSSSETFDTLMKMLDGELDTADTMTGRYASASVKSALDSIAGLSDPVTADVSVNPAVSGLVQGSIPAPYSISGSTAAKAESSYELAYDSNISLDEEDIPEEIFDEIINSDTKSNAQTSTSQRDTGRVTEVSGMTHSARSIETYSESLLSEYSTPAASTRKYADEYPVEAAFADSTGTKMVDIRFIGNTAINGRIKTDEIIAYSQKGKAVTDIGWCGRGRLGEVITYADGRQRFEIIGNKGSSYFYTTGKYTLDQMMSKDVPYGYFVGKLTPEEIAIVHYATEYTAEEQEEMAQFEAYAVAHANSLLY